MKLTPEQERARGIQAENLMRDEMLQEAMREMMFIAHRAFEAARGDPAKLQRASDLFAMAGDFQLYLTRLIAQGKAASNAIDREMQAGKTARTFHSLVRNRNARDDMPWSAAG